MATKNVDKDDKLVDETGFKEGTVPSDGEILEKAQDPLQTEFFEQGDTNPQPEGVDGSLEFLQSDGEELVPDPEGGKTKHNVKVQDQVLYCRGYKDTGEKDEDGNRILEPDYAPATIYEVDEDRKDTGHVLLVYEAENGAKQPAYAHNASGVPGYWTHKTSNPQ